MYLDRYVDQWLSDWKNKKEKKPALVVGVRQCGKTKSIENFGEKFYKNVVKMNFWNNKDYCSDFNTYKKVRGDKNRE